MKSYWGVFIKVWHPSCRNGKWFRIRKCDTEASATKYVENELFALPSVSKKIKEVTYD